MQILSSLGIVEFPSIVKLCILGVLYTPSWSWISLINLLFLTLFLYGS
jgi:hypothetical protein